MCIRDSHETEHDDDRVASCLYAIAVDAKYTGRISEKHWGSVAKYNEIRSTRSGKQVGRQLWLAFPGATQDSNIVPEDPGIRWGNNGPSCGFNEVMRGTVRLQPAESAPEEDESDAWLGRPENTALEFTKGIASFLGVLKESTAATSGESSIHKAPR